MMINAIILFDFICPLSLIFH